jgi:hypothetical protein
MTDGGIHFDAPKVEEVKKYPYVEHAYILERLMLIPEYQQNEIPVSKLSYEPIWAYLDRDGNPLPPIWNATKLIVDTLHAAMGRPKGLRRYVDDEKNTTPEGRDIRIKELQDELFGNETNTADALRYKQGIVVPSNYKGVE